MYVVIALAAAFAFACSSVLKHRSAGAVPSTTSPGRGQVTTLVLRTLRHRLWWWAIAVDVVAVVLQIVALHLGPLSVVQPLLGIALIFALAVTARGRLSRRVWTSSVVLLGCLAAVSLLVRPAVPSTAPDLLPSVVGGGLVVVIAGGCVVLSGRVGKSVLRAVALGGGVGVLYAVNAALLKVLAAVGTTSGVAGVLTSWQLYVVLFAGALGLLLNQGAFHAGELHHALPAMAVADPLTGILVGVAVFDESLVGGPVGVALMGATVVVMTLATVRLSTSAATRAETGPRSETDRPSLVSS